jgi:hypothetical protein
MQNRRMSLKIEISNQLQSENSDLSMRLRMIHASIACLTFTTVDATVAHSNVQLQRLVTGLSFDHYAVLVSSC